MPRNKARTLLCGAAAMLASGSVFAAEPTCPVVPAAHIVLQTTREALSHTQPITVVALGSSSTEGAGASAPDRTYPARLAMELRQAWPDAAVHVLNKGIGGQMVDSVLARIDADVLAQKPTLVIWQVGTNEVLLGMDEARFAAQLDEGVRRILASGADLVLMDNQIAPRESPERLAVVDAIIAREARTRHVPLFSRSALMRSWQTEDPPVTGMIGPDGLHHTDRGYACVAEALGEAIVDAAAKGVPVADLKKK
jgi:lysophospholipase L1-like esterase